MGKDAPSSDGRRGVVTTVLGRDAVTSSGARAHQASTQRGVPTAAEFKNKLNVLIRRRSLTVVSQCNQRNTAFFEKTTARLAIRASGIQMGNVQHQQYRYAISSSFGNASEPKPGVRMSRLNTNESAARAQRQKRKPPLVVMVILASMQPKMWQVYSAQAHLRATY
eukprot:3775792-Pleurochrysis_carterae.AAC.4